MRTLARVCVFVFFVAVLSSIGASVAGTTPNLRELPESYLLRQAGKLTRLHAKTTYQASQFPIALRLTPPDSSWSGAQWKSSSAYQSSDGGPPFFGWAAVGQGNPANFPRGLITITTAYARTPSFAAVVAGLRSRGHGAKYETTTPVKIAGFSGLQFDGERIATATHTFVPFSPRSHSARYYPDAYPVYGQVFRVIVLNVRGKTVVVFIENVVLPADQFPSFLTRANQILNTLRFPG